MGATTTPCGWCCGALRWSPHGVPVVPASAAVFLAGAMAVLLFLLSRIYAAGLALDLAAVRRRRRRLRAVLSVNRASRGQSAGPVSAVSSGKKEESSLLIEKDTIVDEASRGSSGISFVLPIYYVFALCAGLLFLFEAILHLVPHPDSVTLLLLVRYIATAGCMGIDAFMVFFLLLGESLHKGVWATGGSLGVGAVVMIFLYALPQNAASSCTFCGIHSPTPYIWIAHGIAGLFYAFLAGASFFGQTGRGAAFVANKYGDRPGFVRGFIRRVSVRRQLSRWCAFLVCIYTLSVVSVVLIGAVHSDAGYCIAQILVFFTALFYPLVLWYVVTRDSVQCLEDGLLDHGGLVGGIGDEPSEFDRLIDPSAQLAHRPSMDEPVHAIAVESMSRHFDALFRDTNIRIISFDDLVMKRRLGAGSAGDVWLATWTPHDTPVAVKQLLTSVRAINESDSAALDSALRMFVREVRLTARLSHPNLAPLIGVCLDIDHLSLVSAYFSEGSLFALLHSLHREMPDRKGIFRIIRGIARALSYLHGLHPAVLHRDLKSPNVVLDENLEPRVIDLGLARARAVLDLAPMTAVGTTQWASPECLLREEYSEAADVYSFGVILYELLTRQPPWSGISPLAAAQRVAAGERPQLPLLREPTIDSTFVRAEDAVADLAQKCWAQAPSARPTFDQILTLLRDYADLFTGTWQVPSAHIVDVSCDEVAELSPAPTEPTSSGDSTMKCQDRDVDDARAESDRPASSQKSVISLAGERSVDIEASGSVGDANDSFLTKSQARSQEIFDESSILAREIKQASTFQLPLEEAVVAASTSELLREDTSGRVDGLAPKTYIADDDVNHASTITEGPSETHIDDETLNAARLSAETSEGAGGAPGSSYLQSNEEDQPALKLDSINIHGSDSSADDAPADDLIACHHTESVNIDDAEEGEPFLVEESNTSETDDVPGHVSDEPAETMHVVSISSSDHSLETSDAEAQPSLDASVATDAQEQEHSVVLCGFVFVARSEREMDITVGDRIAVAERDDSGWWRGMNLRSNAVGWFPHNYCQPTNEVEVLFIPDEFSQSESSESELESFMPDLTKVPTKGCLKAPELTAERGGPRETRRIVFNEEVEVLEISSCGFSSSSSSEDEEYAQAAARQDDDSDDSWDYEDYLRNVMDDDSSDDENEEAAPALPDDDSECDI